MFQEEYNTIIQSPANIMDIALADIRGIAERYPYCQTAHVIYAKKLRELNSPLFDRQVKHAAVLVYDRNALYQYLEQVVTQEHAMAGFEADNGNREDLVFENEFIETIIEENDASIAEAGNILPTAELEAPASNEAVNIVENLPANDAPIEVAFDTPAIEAALEAIPELNNDPLPEEILAEALETVMLEEILVMSDEVKLEEVIDVEEAIQPDYKDNVIEEIVNTELISEIPDEQLGALITEKDNEPQEIEIAEEAVPMEDEILIQELLSETLVEADWEHSEASIDNDEPIFDLPAYDIERELGTLADEDKYEVFTRKQPVAEQNDEVFVDSFVGWLERLGSPSKGKVVEMKVANMPVKKYLQASPVAGVTDANARQEKVIDEIIAGDLAKKSIQMHDDLVTETYARILVMQGKYAKAVEMYMKLSLLKPQKSDYFAALIDQLKKRIK